MPPDNEGISLDIPPADVLAVTASIDRFVAETGRSLDDAVRFAVWHVMRSLGSSTRRAKKLRYVYQNKGTPKHPATEYPYYIKYWRRGHEEKYFFHKDEDPNGSPKRKVARAGLAASSWIWAMKYMGRPKRATVRNIPGVLWVTQGREGKDLTVTVENRLRYIATVLRRSGARPVETAFERAARGINHYLEQRLERAARRAG